MEYCPGGELFSLLKAKKRFPLAEIKFYTANVLLAFKRLHHLNIVYKE